MVTLHQAGWQIVQILRCPSGVLFFEGVAPQPLEASRSVPNTEDNEATVRVGEPG